MSFPLAAYLEKFPELCHEKFRQTYDLDALEERFREHGTGKRFLTSKDVARIFSPGNTPFGKYWSRPHNKVIEQVLKTERVYLGPLPSDPRPLITRLLAIFHNIGTISLLLRFVYPERFVVFSTPVIHLLQVTRPNTLDLYLAYCEELARWKEHFRIPSVAKTEMAVWTYAEVAKKADTHPAAAKAVQAFDQDYWVQRQRVAQVLRPFMQRYGRLQLAEILLDEDPILAGKIAAEEYERLLDIRCRSLRGRPLPLEQGAAVKLIEELADRGTITLEDKMGLKRIWEIRNNAVHPRKERPEREEVEVMIENIQSICQPWEKGRGG